MAKRGKFTDDGYIELYNDDGTSQLIGANSSGANTKTILPATSGTVPASGLPAVGSNGEVLTVVSGAWASATAGGGGSDNFPLIMASTADTSVTSSTTLVDVTGMSVALEASSTYLMNGLLFLSSGNFTGGLRVAFTPVSGWTGYASWSGNNSVGNASDAFSFVSVSTQSAPNPIALIRGVIVTTGADTLQLQFAQATSNGTTTTIAAGSFIQLRKIS